MIPCPARRAPIPWASASGLPVVQQREPPSAPWADRSVWVGAAAVRSRADWRKGVAEVIDPTAEDEHWAAHYSGTSYVKPGADYKTHQPAYRYGWESFQRYPGRSFDAVEPATRTATEGSPCSGPPEKPGRHAHPV